MIFFIIFIIIVPLGYLIKYGIGLSKTLPDEGKGELQSEVLSEYPGGIIKTKNYIVRDATASYIEIRNIKSILRQNYDPNPAYNKFYSDSIVIIDISDKEMVIEYKMPKVKLSCLDEMIQSLSERNDSILIKGFQRQSITE